MELVDLPLDKITIKDRARKDKGDIASLAESITAKGLIQPITVDQNNRLIAGERRYLAHKHANLKSVLAIRRQVNDKIDAIEIELVENVQRKDLLWPEQAMLEEKIMTYKSGVDKKWTQERQAKLTGNSIGTVNRRLQLAAALELLPELMDCQTEDEAYKLYKKIEEGEVVKMMKDRVPAHVAEAVERASEHYMIGDAFEGLAGCKNESVHFAEVDPPYGVDLDARKSRNSNGQLMASYQEWNDDSFPKLFGRTCQEVYRILKPHSFAVFWYGMSRHHEVMQILRAVGFGIPDIPAIWYKGDSGQTASPDTTLGSCYEPFFLARKGQPKLAKPGRGNVFNFPPINKKIHATEKPLLLMRNIMETILFPGSMILCPFLGSGVTLRAAYRLKHTGFGWDLSQEHKNGFLRRVAEDKKEATIEATA